MIIPSLLQIPVLAPRIPIGLGSLPVEVEAQDAGGAQVAAMVWARQAQVLGSSTTVSKIGEAYALADELGQEVSHLLVDGTSPFGGLPAMALERASWRAVRLRGRPVGLPCLRRGTEAIGYGRRRHRLAGRVDRRHRGVISLTPA